MFDSIYTSMSGLMGFSNGLRTISNNVTNMNTLGFRGSRAGFSNLFVQSGGIGGAASGAGRGAGVTSQNTLLNLQPGSYQASNSPTDVAILGGSFFVVRDERGNLSYTRNGQFHIEGNRLMTADGHYVQAFGGSGLQNFDISSFMTSAGKPTSAINLGTGSVLDTTLPSYVTEVTVFDGNGGKHTLTLQFNKDANQPNGANRNWTVTVKEGNTTVGTAPLVFDDTGKASAATVNFPLSFNPGNAPTQTITLSFSGLTSAPQTQTNITFTADGQALGSLQGSAVSFDETGTLILTYSNGQKVKGPQLALALISDLAGLEELSGSRFRVRNASDVRYGLAGDLFGTISPNHLEGSNVELSSEFSDLILYQRGYQASSQVITTANQMLESLLRMKSGS